MMTGPGIAGAPAVTRTRRVSRQRRCSEAGALPWQGQIAKATRGRDLHLNVPFPRKPPDLLMAESPPTGGVSALTGPAAPRLEPCQSTLEVRCGTRLWRTAAPCGSISPGEADHHGFDER